MNVSVPKLFEIIGKLFVENTLLKEALVVPEPQPTAEQPAEKEP